MHENWVLPPFGTTVVSGVSALLVLHKCFGVTISNAVASFICVVCAQHFFHHMKESASQNITPHASHTKTCKTQSAANINLFVYGTLKRKFQWNKKYLHQRRSGPNNAYASFKSTATSSTKHLLLVGQCGVPYLSLLPTDSGDDDAGYVVGELWQISPECLQNLDEYEGVGKGYYKRERIDLQLSRGEGCSAFVYCLDTLPKDLRKTASSTVTKTAPDQSPNSREPLVEYTLEVHQALYNPVQHILVKQLGYIDHNASAWGHSRQPVLYVNKEAATCVDE